MNANTNTNIDLFSIPLYYISFTPNEKVEKQYRDAGFKNVNHFPAVKGKELDLDGLLKRNIISIRFYEDIRTGRESTKGAPSAGAVGCTLSHYDLWNKCVNNNFPYIIIAEEDNTITDIPEKAQTDIIKALQKPRSIFLSPTRSSGKNRSYAIIGTHFYFARKDACKQMIKYCFPIDVQTDWYISHLHQTGKVNLEGYKISVQNNPRSSIQNSCIKCKLPKSDTFYIVVFISIAIIIALLVFVLIKLYKRSQCECK